MVACCVSFLPFVVVYSFKFTFQLFHSLTSWFLFLVFLHCSTVPSFRHFHCFIVSSFHRFIISAKNTLYIAALYRKSCKNTNTGLCVSLSRVHLSISLSFYYLFICFFFKYILIARESVTIFLYLVWTKEMIDRWRALLELVRHCSIHVTNTHLLQSATCVHPSCSRRQYELPAGKVVSGRGKPVIYRYIPYIVTIFHQSQSNSNLI